LVKLPMSNHQSYKFSVTIHTDDHAIVGCLRALAKFSQKEGSNNIPWGGTKDKDWVRDGHRVTFRFSATHYRAGFLAQVKRLLSVLLYSVNDQVIVVHFPREGKLTRR
jgi:hypothetical protein